MIAGVSPRQGTTGGSPGRKSRARAASQARPPREDESSRYRDNAPGMGLPEAGFIRPYGSPGRQNSDYNRPRMRIPLLLAAALLGQGADPAQPGRTVQVLEEGAVAHRQIVALGHDLVVAGEALTDVVVLSGSLEVSGRVAGDAIVLGGEVALAPTARVEGDLFVLGGTVRAASGARIGGRSVAFPSVAGAWLTLMEGPTLGLSPFSPVVLGMKLGLLTAWMALTLLLFAVGGREVLATCEGVEREPLRNFLVGLVALSAMVLTALTLLALATALVGVPLLVLLVVLALLLKFWGTVAVFHALGAWLGRTLLRRRLAPLNAATLGLAALGVVKLLPWLGAWAWMAASLIGIGATLTTKFGRREPWFQPAEVLGALPQGRP